MTAGAPVFGRRVTVCVYALLTLAVLAPVFAVPIPALGDYLNHLARVHVLATVSHAPDLQQYYQQRWRLVPYFGFDVPVLMLAQFMGIYAAGRVFVAVCVLMPVLAAGVLHYAAYGRVGLVPALGFLLSYGFLLEAGFLNFIFVAGLAVMLFAGWIASAGWRRWWRALIFGVAALMIYLGHPFGFLAYGLLVAGFEMDRLLRHRARLWHDTVLDLCAAAAQALPTLAFVLFVQQQIAFPNSTGNFIYKPFLEQATGLLMPLYFPGQGWLVTAFFVLPLAILIAAPWLRLSPRIWPGLAVTALVACCVPRLLFSIYGTDFRLPLVVAIVAIAAVSRSAKLHRPAAAAILAGLVFLVLARSVDALIVLRRLDGQVTEIRRVLADLPAGKRLLVVEADKTYSGRLAPYPMTNHFGLLATIDRDAFVPFLFTGTQPLQLWPKMERSSSIAAGAISFAQLREGEGPEPAGPLPEYLYSGQKYWLGWPGKFDYVLIIHFGDRNEPLPPSLRPLTLGPVASLYEIMKE